MFLRRITDALWRLVERGALPSDSEQERLKKAVLTIISGIIAFLAIFWGSLYVLSGYPLPGAIPLSYAAISFASIAHFFITRQFGFFRFSQLLLILLLPFLLQWSLGGFANGSAVMVWAFFAPLAALFFADIRTAQRWLTAFIVLVVISGIVDSAVSTHAATMPRTINTLYFVMNMGCGFVTIYIVLHYFVRERERAHKQLGDAYERLQQNEIRIRELMLTDPLTGVANRRYLDERLADEIARARRYGTSVGIIMSDIDNFKLINDRYGHIRGDGVLRTFAEIAQTTVRGSDFVARYGGEEFVLLLAQTSGDGAEALAERIRVTLEQRKTPEIDETVTASFGVTVVRADDEPDTVLKRVDEALYAAKKGGRNRVVRSV